MEHTQTSPSIVPCAFPTVLYTSSPLDVEDLSEKDKEALTPFTGGIGIIFSTGTKTTPIRVYFGTCKQQYDIAPSGIQELLRQTVEESRSSLDESLATMNELAQLVDAVIKKLKDAGRYDDTLSLMDNFNAFSVA